MKRISFAILALCISAAASAQSAQWSLAPVYKQIDQITPNLFRISSAKKVGVATADGTILVDTIADAISNVANGYAVTVNKGKKKSDILAIIDENGTSILNDQTVEEAIAQSKGKKKDKKSTLKLQKLTADGPQTFSEKSKFGYKSGEIFVLPPQFISAQPFVGGYAIAQTETGYGILKLIPQTFTCKQTSAVPDSGMEKTTHSSSIPANAEATLKIKCVDSTGMTFENEGVKKDNSILYELSTFKERRTFTVIANDSKGSLVLWNSNFDNVEKKEAGSTKTTTKSKKKAKTKSKKKK